MLLLTGRPGVGKTSVLLRIVEALRVKGFTVGGVVTREVRMEGARVGFEILDLNTGSKGWLAHMNQEQGLRVGKYGVNLKNLEDIGVQAITNAVRDSEVIVIDEAGPMELHSEAFKQAVRGAANSSKLVVGVVHWAATDRLIDELRGRNDARLYSVLPENRESLHLTIVEEALEFLSETV